MASEPTTPFTAIQEPGMAGMPRTYTTTREVAAEYEPPERGSVVGKILPRYKTHIVLDAQVMPKGGKRLAVISHCSAPNWRVLIGTQDRASGNGEHLYERQVVVTPAQSVIEADAKSTYEPIDEVKSLRVTKRPRRRKPDNTFEDGYPQKQIKSVGDELLVPAKHRDQTVTTRTTSIEPLPHAEVNDIPAPVLPVPRADVIKITHEKLNDEEYAKVIEKESIAENASPLVGQSTDTWGINATSEQLVEHGSSVTPGFGIKSARVIPIGNGKSIQETETYPPDSNADGVIYTLQELKVDDKTGIIMEMEKSLIDASRYREIYDAKAALGWFPEVQPIDKWHSIMVSAKVDLTALPANETWIETASFNLPNVLTEVGVIWDSDSDRDIGTSGISDQSYIEDNDIKWSASAEVVVNGSVTGRPYTKIKAGARGQGQVTVVRSYHDGPPSSAVGTHQFNEVYGMLLIHAQNGVAMAKATQTGKGSYRFESALSYRRHIDNKLVIHDFGPIVHSGGLSIQNLGDASTVSQTGAATTGSLPGSGGYPAPSVTLELAGKVTLDLPVSGPVLTTGQSYVHGVEVTRWGFGVWVKEVYTMLIP